MKNIFLVAIFLGLIGLLTYHFVPQKKVFYGAYSPTGGGTYRLQSSIGTSDSSVSLSSFKEPVSNILYTMSYLGSDIEYGTIDPQTNRAEFVSFTGITQNSDGSATLTGLIRGLARSPGTGGCVASTTLTQAHAGQSIFILSNPPCQLAEYAPLRNIATIKSTWTFGSTTPPRYDFVGVQANGTFISTTSEFASIAYVNAIATSGAPNITTTVKGIGQLATALQDSSSTITGSTGANLLMASANATDTPQSGCGVGFTSVAGAACTVIADLTGSIGNFLNKVTQAITWTKLHTFNSGILSQASSTFSATTSIAASSVTNNALSLNGINYAFPSVQGASTTFLATNGSGVLSWSAAIPLRYTSMAFGSASAGQGSSATSSVLLVIPSGAVSASSTISVRGTASCVANNGASSVTTCINNVVNQNGTTIGTLSIQSGTNASANGFFDMKIYMNNSVSSEEYSTNFALSNSDGNNNGTTNVNLSGATSLYITTSNTVSVGGTGGSSAVTQVIAEFDQ